MFTACILQKESFNLVYIHGSAFVMLSTSRCIHADSYVKEKEIARSIFLVTTKGA